MIRQFVTAGAIFATIIGSATAQVARLEVHAISTVTLSDSDFLAGRSGGQPVTIAGELRIPKAGTDKLPAVVLLHGSGGIGGIGSMIDEWSRELNQLGIATLAVDSFASRGITSTVISQAQLGRLNMVADAYRALDLLAKHPRIDSNRVAIMGFSRGGQSALYSAMNRLYGTLGPANNLRFAAHIAFYPDCTTTYLGDADVSDKPIRMLHGTSDNYNPVAPCRAYAQRLTDDHRDVKLIEYPGVYHVFDAPAFRTPLISKGATTTRRCQLMEGDDHQIINRETQKPFAYSDACVERDPTLAYNESASSQARVFVRGFLTEVFQLKQ
ncbi:dienelactone hydrolase family protein [Bradyrhizobium sp. CCBAU 53421]|uniref:dienelactone hydrolase family protein n=1 Tax=Bradyrhizobium sp. CCBAU 53421 TaxID=1325120 RepID=UPI00188BFAF9|nr:dienelactone hydrolase family protein [Bradyrhizobium sp. CCBAU 53421]QOZ37943.1 carboxymethylenebutenolidase [Bradyrhizobium sp. CCBAU 53421]